MDTATPFGSPLYVMLKPAGSLCNLDCSYCYYTEKRRLYGQEGRQVMADDVLETFVRQYIEAQTMPEVLFTWHGGEPLMVPVGHVFAKKVLRESGAIGGGELAGHYYFRDFHCCDSGILAAIRILGKIAASKRNGASFSQMVAPVKGRWANSGERNYRCENKDAAMERVKSAFSGEVNNLDGYRIEMPEGWISVRKSNTEPYLRLIVEAESDALMRSWIEKAERAVNEG